MKTLPVLVLEGSFAGDKSLMPHFPRYISANDCNRLLLLFDAVTSIDANVIEINAKDTCFVDPWALFVGSFL